MYQKILKIKDCSLISPKRPTRESKQTITLNCPFFNIFYVLVASKQAYAAAQGDPFELAGRFLPDWDANSELQPLESEEEILPPRTVADVQKVLKQSNGPELLGGCQALIDGRSVFSSGIVTDMPRYSNATSIIRRVVDVEPKVIANGKLIGCLLDNSLNDFSFTNSFKPETDLGTTRPEMEPIVSSVLASCMVMSIC